MSGTLHSFPVDYSAILYLSQVEPNHTNVYRFTMQLNELVCPEALQKAADRVFSRFPTIFAGFRPGFLDYRLVPMETAPRVLPDHGLLKTMSPEEMEKSAYRILYKDNEVSIEAFHALTDGYGAIMSFRTLVAEYLFVRYGLHTPERTEMLEQSEPDWETEWADSYLDYARENPSRPANRPAFQLSPGERSWEVKEYVRSYSTTALLTAGRRCGVSMATLLSGLMAETIMELQKETVKPGKEKPVRIMVPIDLRRQFSSKTLRNFILYALPTLEWEEAELPRAERFSRFQTQLRSQSSRDYLAPQIAANVNAQQLWIYRMLPLKLKCTLMKLAYRFFGECNSSITLTNLGSVAMSGEMREYVKDFSVYLTPRRTSPYNCGLISLGDTTNIAITRFCKTARLEKRFFQKLDGLIAETP